MTMINTAKREMEWQFSAEGLEATRAWIAQQPVDYSERRFAPLAAVELRDTYYDSTDWMIFRAGFALRVRQVRDESGSEGNELTLKSLTPARGGFASRLEYSAAIPRGDIRLALVERNEIGEKLRTLVGDRPLVPLFRAHTHRERHLLLEGDTDLPLAELDLDQTSIESPDGQSRQLVRIEVECMNAEPAVLAPLVERLRQSAGLTPSTQSKFRSGLDVSGLAAKLPMKLPERAMSAAQPLAVSQLAVLTRYFQVILDQEPAARAGSTHAVHEMRVAARHLETLLKAFAPYGQTWAVRSRAAIRSLVKALGRVRDCDVQIGYLEAAAGQPETEPLALIPIRERLDRDRAEARASLAKLLDSDENLGWMRLWRQELGRGDAPIEGPGSVPTARTARELIRGQARKLRKRAELIDERSTPDDYHEVRIRAKRLRYVLDAFAKLYGDAGTDYLKVLVRLQDILGEYHDATVRAQRFRKIAADDRLSGAASFALGRMVESESPALKTCREKFPKAWRRARRKRWRALEVAMQNCAAELS